MISMEENILQNQGPQQSDFQGVFQGTVTTPNQIPQAIVAGINPPPRKKTKVIALILLCFILIVALAGATYFLGLRGKSTLPIPGISSLQQDKEVRAPFLENQATRLMIPQEVEGTEGWVEYKKEGEFSFKYPADVIKQEFVDGSIAITFRGPTQEEATEFKDGISISFKTIDPQGRSLKEVTDGSYLELKDIFETTRPIVASLAKASGYTFHVKGYIDGDYYYVAINPSLILEVINATKDPTNAGFAATAEKVLLTLNLSP